MKKCYSGADILLPDFTKNEPQKWAVVACDQFTSEPEYWEKAQGIVGDAPSTLNMILPEVYLEETAERIPRINETMLVYEREILNAYPDSMIYVERTQSDGTVRHGIVMAIDLEAYDYRRGADSLIRATEATVVERIPPRVAIRRNASIELPHVMLLIDDPKKTVIEPLAGANVGEVVYDFDLMLDGGHIRGTIINREYKNALSKALDELISAEAMAKKYGKDGLSPLLFAVGDGNHSLASAKAAYEEIKERVGIDAAKTHPARYALVEVVNIHDVALKFEPIYRIVTDVDCDSFISELEGYLGELSGNAEEQRIEYIYGDKSGTLIAKAPEQQLTVGTLQKFIDEYISVHPDTKVDYIHGESSVMALAKKENSVGFLFDGMEKSQLFKTVIFDGALPRKTFSMGHATDKRYYLECRKIK
ncbi:MAG: DUF1015 domain-containing protein [Clostridia bacterium]|nr:DUF1015 domain-containing protein [Clostridia bacterium]